MVKNVTLSAEELLINEARKRAQLEHKSLNTVFREWLFRYAFTRKNKTYYSDLMNRLEYADAGRHYSRKEMKHE